MGAITLLNFRTTADVMMNTKLKDGGVYIEWSSLTEVKAWIWSDAQKALAGRVDVSVDTGDATVLKCLYASTKPQYPGVNRLIVQGRYNGSLKTYDKPVFNFVPRTAEATGSITISDPEVDVEIEVTDTTSSILDNTIAAALAAAAHAEHAASLVPLQVLQDCEQATEDAQLAKENADEAAEEARDVAEHAEPIIGQNGNWHKWNPVTREYEDTGKPSRGIQGETGLTPDISIGTVLSVEPTTPASVTLTGTPEAPVLNIRIPRGQKGEQGNPGSSVDYPFELVNNRTTDDPNKAVTAAEAKRIGDDIAELENETDVVVEFTDTPTVNLFDKTAAVSGKYVNKNNGNLSDSSTGKAATDFIPIDERGLYFDVGYSGGSAIGAAVYDSSKQYRRAGGTKRIDYEDGDAYVRFTFDETNIETGMCVAGTADDVPSSYVPYGVVREYSMKESVVETRNLKDKAITEEKTADGVLRANELVKDTPYISPNLFNKETAAPDKAIDVRDGDIFTVTGRTASDYIPIPDGATSLYTNKLVGAGVLGWAAYDSSKTFTRGGQSATIGIQSGDAFIRITIASEDVPACMVVAGTSADIPEEYVPYGELHKYSLKDDSVETSNIKDKAVTEEKIADGLLLGKKVVNVTQRVSPNLFDKSTSVAGRGIDLRDGDSLPTTGSSISDYIPVPDGATSLYTNYAYLSGVLGFAFYNSEKVFTHGGQAATMEAQEGDKFLRFTLPSANADECMLVVGTSANIPAEYVPYGILEDFSLKNDTVPFDALIFKTTQSGKNKLNPSDVAQGKYVSRDTGRILSSSSLSATGFIPVSRSGLYFNKYYVGGTEIGAAVYNEGGVFIRSATNPYIFQDGDAFVRYSFHSEDLPTAQVEEGTAESAYEPYSAKEVIDPQFLPSSSKSGGDKSLELFLPDKLYAVVGDTLQVFYKGIVKAVNPLNYDITIRCSKGRRYRRYWEYTPQDSDIGTTVFNVIVRDDNGETIGTTSCELITVAAPSSPASAMNVICIGSSTTANGIWPAEAYRRLVGSGGSPSGKGLSNIAFRGMMQKDGAGYIGKSGWGWVDYCTQGRPAFRFTIGYEPNVSLGNVYTNNGYSYTVIEISDDGTILCSTSSTSNTPSASGVLTKTSGSGDATVAFTASAQDSQNPFWDYDNNKLTFIPYANNYCDGRIDVVYVSLGLNGSHPFMTDFSQFEEYIHDFADTLHAEFPSAKMVLMSYCFPSMELMMPGYGSSATGDVFGDLTTVFNLQKCYQAIANDPEYSSFVSFLALAPETDSDYNFPITMKDVNTRNSDYQEPYANNTIHVGTPGYLQFGDAVYRHISAYLLSH